MASRERITITGSTDARLAGIIDWPADPPRAIALLAHCFTCSKDTIAAARIAGGLATAGIAVLRIDFTGLGESEGEFADTTFSSNIEDLVLAADYLRERGHAPSLLIGHSLGGAAVLAAAEFIPELRAVATIAAPAELAPVRELFGAQAEVMAREGEAVVTLAGRPILVRQSFVEDLAEHSIAERVAELARPLLLLHAPEDNQVAFVDAERLYAAARQPKSLISLDGADHLLLRDGAATRVADLIAAWAEPYLDAGAVESLDPGLVVVESNGRGKFGHTARAGQHSWLLDEPVNVPGAIDSGPNPYDLLLASLGGCTAMTMRMYADRKGLRLEDVSVSLRHKRIHARDCEDCESVDGHITRIDREITMTGDLTADERAALLRIADKCPVHRTLEAEITIHTAES
ncbi:bifunctional alpha/beta hydrolase/OsmC family protein [Tomitella biformata]|uniref:bifunctional alpha/beta hydrolase/OsmC family protein n=1 Tax=Tomitella biformata TaxID=630403 RepID=UPI0004671EEE|nr:bifunctional alpha/beta hydrolase/OsmC family protein [Tomitella biformata]